LDEYFTSLVAELTREDPNAVSTNYLANIKPHLPVAYLQQIRSVHAKLFLGTTKTSATEAIGKQKEWMAASKAIERTTLIGLMRECIASDNKNAALVQLLELVSKDSNFSGWQYFLKFVSIAAVQDDLEVYKLFKVFLKDTFANCIARKSQHLFHVLMLTARQLSYSAAAKFQDYQKWYKDTIGEMVYSNLKVTAEPFEFVMSLLTGMIEFETDPDLVNVS
jgi:Fanconi anaemia group A protein N terminus